MDMDEAVPEAPPPFSGDLKTDIKRPSFHTPEATEWTFDDASETVLTNMKITNLGFYRAAGVIANTHATLGMLSLIRNVIISANGREIESQRNFNRLALFRLNMDKTRADADDVGILRGSGLTESRTGSHVIANGRAPERGVRQTSHTRPAITSSAATTATAEFTLRDALGFLRATPLLHSSVMGQIKIRIEWETEPYVAVPSVEANGQYAGLTTPLLSYTYSPDPQAAAVAKANLSKPITFSTWLTDLYYVNPPNMAGAAGVTTVKQEEHITPKAFNGHFISRMLHIHEPRTFRAHAAANSAEARLRLSNAYGRLQSAARYKGTDKIFVNGLPLIGSYGIDTTARRMALLNETYDGTLFSPPGSSVCGAIEDAIVKDGDLYAGDYMGVEEFVGYPVNQYVASMRLEWTRECPFLSGNGIGGFGAASDQRLSYGLIIRLFGEALRTRLPNGTVMATATQ